MRSGPKYLVLLMAMIVLPSASVLGALFTPWPRLGAAFAAVCWLVVGSCVAAILARRLGAGAQATSVNVDRQLQTDQVALDRSQARFASLVNHATDVIAVMNGAGILSYISPSCRHVFGFPPEQVIGRNVLAFGHRADSKRVKKFISALQPSTDSKPEYIEARFRDRNGGWRVLELAVTDLRHDPAVNGIVLNAHDVTDRKALEEDLQHRVLHDALTGIANRVLFRDRASHALTKRSEDLLTAALFIDLDDFKTVNDGLGHGVGDELLQVIAYRLNASVRESDTTARLGGDEFAVLLEDMNSLDDIIAVAENLTRVLDEPLDFKGHEIRITASIGIATSATAKDVDELLRNADVAMYHAKWAGKGRVEVFSEMMHQSALERLELKVDLAYAVEREELRLFYQPQIDMNTGQLKGFEALVRWQHPKRGLLAPDSFVSLAEETGVIAPMGAWILQEATRQLGEWQRQFAASHLTMSINVSPLQLTEHAIVDQMRDALDSSRVEAECIVLELTESAVLDDAMGRDRLRQLGQLGVGIAADDFGSGFASYAALQQLPFTELKIDRSLLSGLSSSFGRAEAQLQSIVEMAHATGVEVVAEGIETEEQLRVLQAMSCDIGQGYYFGRPTTTLEVEEMLLGESAAVRL